MIEKWKNTYCEYMNHNDVPVNKQDDMWCTVTNSLIALWHKMENGEIEQIYRNFNHFLNVQIDYYERINANYRRDSRKKPVEVVKSNGGRYWL